MLKVRWIVLAAFALLTLVPAAAALNRPQTTEPTDVVDVRVNITDSKMTLSTRILERGVVGRFLIRNLGRRPHSFAFDVEQKPGAGLIGELSTEAIAPGKRKTLLVFLDYRGKYRYGSILPADQKKPRMFGEFQVV